MRMHLQCAVAAEELPLDTLSSQRTVISSSHPDNGENVQQEVLALFAGIQ